MAKDKKLPADELYEDDGKKPLSHNTDAQGRRSHYSNTNRYDGDGKEDGHLDNGHAARHLHTNNGRKGRYR